MVPADRAASNVFGISALSQPGGKLQRSSGIAYTHRLRRGIQQRRIREGSVQQCFVSQPRVLRVEVADHDDAGEKSGCTPDQGVFKNGAEPRISDNWTATFSEGKFNANGQMFGLE